MKWMDWIGHGTQRIRLNLHELDHDEYLHPVIDLILEQLEKGRKNESEKYFK